MNLVRVIPDSVLCLFYEHHDISSNVDLANSKILKSCVFESSFPRSQLSFQSIVHLLIPFRYIETIDLIYRTNTIYIRSLALSQHIRSLLLPQRLASIRSLEIVWDFYGDIKFAEYHDSLTRPPLNYSWLMEKIPLDFPSLSSLHVSLVTTFSIADPTPAWIRVGEDRLFGPADKLVRHYGSQLRTCQIAPTRKLFTALLQNAEAAGARIEKGGMGAGFWQQFWRSVTVDDDGSSAPNNVGYWVRQGKDDTPVW